MRVKSCKDSKIEPGDKVVKMLTYYEMNKEEGIYKFTDDRSARVVVVKLKEDNYIWTSVLFYDVFGLEPLGEWARTATFVKCDDEEVCFEIHKIEKK